MTPTFPRTRNERWETIASLLRRLQQIVHTAAMMDQHMSDHGRGTWGETVKIDRLIDELEHRVSGEINRITAEGLMRDLEQRKQREKGA